MDKKNHWEDVYQKKKVDEVSWYQAQPDSTLRLIDSLKLDLKAGIIDVGGGASTLVDCLLSRGYRNVSVLDISGKAIAAAKGRLGAKGDDVKWVESDILGFQTLEKFDFWHDRGVFHFLTDSNEREKYLETMRHTLGANAYVLIVTFDLGGPEQCSGLPVQRYDPELLQKTLGPDYKLLSSGREVHITPWGSPQQFVYCLFKKMGFQ